MIRLDNIRKSYGDRVLFEGASLALHRGERLGLVGRNGTGKSTLFRIIAGEEEADEGSVVLPKAYRIGTLEQHHNFTKKSVLEEAMQGLPAETREMEQYLAEKILFGLGFDQEMLENRPEELSGGYHLRLKLTKALLSAPDCLLLDEPTNYLDIVTIRWLERFLSGWKGECIIISHDRTFLDSVSTHTMGIHRGKVRKYPGTTEKYYEQILLEEEIHEKTRENLEKKKAHAEDFIKRFGTKATKAKQAQSRKKAIEKMPALGKLNSIDSLQFSFHSRPYSSKKMIDLEEVSFSYDEDPLIQDVSFELLPGHRLAVIGKNGRGKSTLLKLLEGELSPADGAIRRSEKVEIGYFGQTHIDRLDESVTIEEEIARANPDLSFSEVKGLCGAMMFSGSDAQKKIKVLSGGERSRVLLGKILASPCNLLLLDEPTHHLDLESVEALMQALKSFSGTVVLVTHSEWILDHFSWDALLICKQQKQRYFVGDYQDFLRKEGWDEDLPSEKLKTTPKLDRKERADIVQKRSRALKPLKAKQSQLEKRISGIELKLEELNQKMVAFDQLPPDEIASLSEEMGTKRKELELLYIEWETLEEQMEETSKEFMF